MTRHVVLDAGGGYELVLVVSIEVPLEAQLRGFRSATLARVVAVGVEPRPKVNTAETLEAVWREINRRRGVWSR